MITKILEWLRGVIDKMIGQTTLKQSLGVDIAVSAPMAEALTLWSQMYSNAAPWLNNDVKSLNLSAAISGEIARAATIEMQVTVSGSARAAFLTAQLERVLPRLREYVEFGCAKGGLMLKPYIARDKRIAVDFVQADQFYPVAFDANGSMTACIFSDQRKIGQYYFTRLEYHAMTATGCKIKNSAFRSLNAGDLGQPCPLESVEAWADLMPEGGVDNVDRLLVGYFRMPGANNIDVTSPLGVSCYSRAASGDKCLIQQADEQWSDLLWEFESGRRALYADVAAFDRTTDGKPVLPIKRLYRTLNSSGNVGEGNKLFDEWSPTFREANILAGLDAMLKKVEFNCGLAYGTLSDPNVVAATATEIKMQKQRSFATITDTQKALRTALENLLYAMNIWATLGKLAPNGSYQAVYEFDDSIVADHDTQFLQDGQALGYGTLAKYEWRMRQYGETKEVAKQKIAEIQAESPPPPNLFGPPDATDQPTDETAPAEDKQAA